MLSVRHCVTRKTRDWPDHGLRYGWLNAVAESWSKERNPRVCTRFSLSVENVQAKPVLRDLILKRALRQGENIYFYLFS